MDTKQQNEVFINTDNSKHSTPKKDSANTFRQILVAVVTSSLHIACGCSFAYSGIAVPQIIVEQNKTNTSETLSSEMLWISSATALMIPFSSVLSGIVIDVFGRLNTLKLSALPNLIGWVLIATAANNIMVIIGRLCTGFSFGFASGSAYVYVAEISPPRIRGVLLSLPGLFIAVGVLLTYFKGWLLNWRWVAWITLIYSIVPVIIVLFLPESPSWLISKGRKSEAKKSLEWFYKLSKQTQTEKLLGVDDELKELTEKHSQKSKNSIMVILKAFIKPTCYKPFIISSILFGLQQFSGIYIITFNSVIFFKDINVKMDPYQISVYISILRLVISIAGIWLTKKFGRRCLIMTSAAGMAICMGISALFTRWIHNESSTQLYVPICMVMLYFAFASAGLQSVPFAIASEIFPQILRGVMQSLVLFVCYSLMFASLHSYNLLMSLFGGSAGLQFFFSAVSLVTVIFTYLFLPETFKKRLSDIEEYFLNRTVYIL